MYAQHLDRTVLPPTYHTNYHQQLGHKKPQKHIQMVKIHSNFHSILLGQRQGQTRRHKNYFLPQNPKLFILLHQAPPLLLPHMNMTSSYFTYPKQYIQY